MSKHIFAPNGGYYLFIFAPNGGYCVYYPSNARSFENWGIFKVYIWPKCFFRFSLSLRHLNMSSNSKKWIPMLFAIKSSFKFPALATPNEVDRVMIDWWRMMSLQEYLEALCFSFACLTTALLGRLPFVCFLSRKTPFHYWNNSYLN